MTAPLRVAFGHYCSPDDISGVTSWLIDLALFLHRQGISVAILLMDLGQPADSNPVELALHNQGVEIVRTPARNNLKQDVKATLDFLNAWRPDVFLPQCKPHHYLAAAIAGRHGLPWALTLHSDDPDYWAVVESLPPSSHGGQAVCVSQHIHTRLASLGGGSDAAIIPYGVALPAHTSQFQAHPFRVVYSGRLWEHQKRADLVVQTLIHACRQGNGALVATVIGDGYSRAACEQQVQQAGLAERIRFTGRLPFADLQRILLESQAILLMSDFEGLPVALLEAMAAGLVPVVRNIASGIPEVVHQGHTGLLVSEDPAEAAAALLGLANDPFLWQRCSEASRQLVEERFSSHRCHQLWLDLLLQLSTGAQPNYPIADWRGVKLSGLSPLMSASYSRPRSTPLLRLRQGLNTRSAQVKGWLKRRLSSQAQAASTADRAN